MAEEKILPDITNIKTSESYLLPSKGYAYREEDNIPKNITLRRMTTREDKIRFRNLTQDKIRRDILQACTPDDIDVNKLKLEDANFLLFKLRVLSLLDDKYKVGLSCPYCGTRFIHELNLSEVPIKYMRKEDQDKFTLTLPLSKRKLNLRLPALGEIISEGEVITEASEKSNDLDRGELIEVHGTMLYIDKVDDEKLLNVELEDFLYNMDIIDSRALAKKIVEVDGLFGVDSTLCAPCPKCSQDVYHGLPITSELFNPSN